MFFKILSNVSCVALIFFSNTCFAWDQNLSKTWAQKLIGSDLSIEEISKYKLATDVPVGVFDAFNDGEFSHGIEVEELIHHQTDFGISPFAITHRYEVEMSNQQGISNSSISYQNFLVDKPWLINQSSNPKLNQPEYSESEKNSVWVVSSGNDYPSKAYSYSSNVIMVGSMSPEGFISGFSGEGHQT